MLKKSSITLKKSIIMLKKVLCSKGYYFAEKKYYYAKKYNYGKLAVLQQSSFSDGVWHKQEEVTYSFLRADLRFSSFSSWAASRSLTSDPGAVAGMMSSWRSLLWRRQSGIYLIYNQTGRMWISRFFTPVIYWNTGALTALLESEEMPRAFSRLQRYLSMRREKSR